LTPLLPVLGTPAQQYIKGSWKKRNNTYKQLERNENNATNAKGRI
jgi:hypothetical protein